MWMTYPMKWTSRRASTYRRSLFGWEAGGKKYLWKKSKKHGIGAGGGSAGWARNATSQYPSNGSRRAPRPSCAFDARRIRNELSAISADRLDRARVPLARRVQRGLV